MENIEKHYTDFQKLLNENFPGICEFTFRQTLSDPHSFFSHLSKFYCLIPNHDIKKKIRHFIHKYKPLYIQYYQEKIQENTQFYPLSSSPLPSITSECLPYDPLNSSQPPSQITQDLQAQIDKINELHPAPSHEHLGKPSCPILPAQLFNLVLSQSSLFEQGSKNYPRCQAPISRIDFVQFFLEQMNAHKTDNEEILEDFKKRFHFIDHDLNDDSD